MDLKSDIRLKGGRYKILKTIGQGGFGITYQALDTYNEKIVAIKEFFPSDIYERCSDNQNVQYKGKITSQKRELTAKAKAKFIGEARKLQKFNHPGIIKLIDNFSENGTAYYVMEHINGSTLSELLERKRFSINETISIIKKIGLALNYIHGKKMLHMDIKPDNIMLKKSNNEPVIIDFGISRSFDELGSAKTSTFDAFSIGYSPKEQLNSDIHVFSPQVDIYSLGATFYTLLTNQRPKYPSPRLAETIIFEDSVPLYVQNIIKKAMAYEPEDRYRTTSEFLNDLEFRRDPYIHKAQQTLKHINEPTQRVYPKTEVHTKKVNNNQQYSQKNNNKIKRGNKQIYATASLIVVCLVILASGIIYYFSTEKNNNLNISKEEKIAIDSSDIIKPAIPAQIEEHLKAEDAEPNSINTSASRQFQIKGYDYNYSYDVQAVNGILYVKSRENGQSNSGQFNYNSTIDAEKIIDQFEGLAYFWAAASVGQYIINDNGFYSEEIMNSTLNLLKKSMNYFSVSKGNSPTAYTGSKSRYDMLREIHKDWENSSSFDPELEAEIEMIVYGMNENPPQAKDIHFKF